MGGSTMGIAKLGIYALGGTIVLADAPLPEPLGYFTQLGVPGLALFLIWWIFAKTIPGIVSEHRTQMKELAEAHAAQIKQITEANAASTKLFVDFLRDRKGD